MDPGSGRWRYGWAVIGAATAAFGLGGILGVARALSYDPPAWGYVIISSAAGLAAFILAIKALRKYGSPRAHLNQKVSRLRRVAADIIALQSLLTGLIYLVLVLFALSPVSFSTMGSGTTENAPPFAIGYGLAMVAILVIGGAVAVALWTGRSWGAAGAFAVEAIWVATVSLLYGFTAAPASAIMLLTVPTATVAVLLTASRARSRARR